MNLLQSRKNDEIMKQDDILSISNFRKYQYNLLEYYFTLMINYLSSQNNNYLELTRVHIYDKISYHGVFNSELTVVEVYVKDISDTSIEKLFTRLYIPTLTHGTSFYLNGNYYMPAMSVVDYPIAIKKKSVMLAGLFHSITINTKENTVIFTGVNIPMQYFLQLLIGDDVDFLKIYGEFLSKHRKQHDIHDDETLFNYFDNKFNIKETSKEDIIMRLEKIFFDPYTYELYKHCYPGEDISLVSIVKKALQMDINDNTPNFIDLKNKRVSFLEILLRPVFDKIASTVKSVRNGYKVDNININMNTLLSYFQTSPDSKSKKKGLSGNFLYDTANLYSGILQHKISMVSPGTQNAPKDVQGIHQSHFKIVCPITVSSQKPGQVVSILPNTKLDFFGRFI